MTPDHMLLTVLAEIEVFAEVPDSALSAPEPYLHAMVTQGVPYRPAAWVGRRLPAARRMACSRSARRLSEAALVLRITDSGRDRVRWLRPTPAGLERALALAGAGADRSAVREGLARTWWGRTLIRAVSAHVATVEAESASGIESAVASPVGERGAKRKKKAAGRRGDSADRSRCRGGDSRHQPSSQTGGDL